MREYIQDCIEFGIWAIVFIAVLFLFLAMLLVPIAYFDGSAKSAWLKQTQNITIPWYQSTFLSVQINDANLKIRELE